MTEFFLSKDVKEGMESFKYNEQLLGITINRYHKGEVEQHMERDRFNAYALWKGSATFSLGGTTTAPPQTLLFFDYVIN